MKTAVHSRLERLLSDRVSDFLATVKTERSFQFARPDFPSAVQALLPQEIPAQPKALVRTSGLAHQAPAPYLHPCTLVIAMHVRQVPVGCVPDQGNCGVEPGLLIALATGLFLFLSPSSAAVLLKTAKAKAGPHESCASSIKK